MYENFLWSGCSFSWGSGFYEPTENNTAMWRHADFPHIFNFGEFDKKLDITEIQLAILPHTFPNLVGKKINCKNTQNLSVPGLGTSMHIRRLMSYIENNKETLDFSKTLVGLQLTSFSRVDLINSKLVDGKGNNWIYSFIFNDAGFQVDSTKDFHKNHFDFDFYVLKHLQEIFLFKKYLDSYNIDSIFVGICKNAFEHNLKLQKKDTKKVYEQINNLENLPISVSFPSIETLLKQIPYFEPDVTIENLVTAYDINDYHFSPKGHEDFSQFIVDTLKKSDLYKI